MPITHGKLSRVQIGMLGPFEVRADDGVLADVPGARLRGLLVALALEPGRVVPKARLVEWIWGEHPPASVDGVVPQAWQMGSRVRIARRVGGGKPMRRQVKPGVLSARGWLLGRAG